MEYQGIDSSNSYLMYNILIALSALIFFVGYLILENPKFRRKDLKLLGLPLVFVFGYLFNILLLGESSTDESRWFTFFLLWSLPSYYLAFTYANAHRVEELTKWIEVIVLLISLSTIFVLVIPMMSDIRVTGIGGASYQTASYISAIAFGLTLYFLLFGSRHKRFKFTQYRLYKGALYLFVLTNFIGAVLSGGRGAFVLVIVYLLFFLIQLIKQRKRNSMLKLSVVLLAIMLLFQMLGSNNAFMVGYNRAIAFINPEIGIDWSGSSGRDDVYLNALDLIQKKPILGYGYFSYWRVSSNPHNILLEILLSGGIIYLSIFLLFTLSIIRKIKRMVKYDTRNRIWVVIILYPFTMLMFSGSYLVSTELWFSLSIVLFYKFR